MLTREVKKHVLICLSFLLILVLSDTIIASILDNNFINISNNLDEYQNDTVYYSFPDIYGRNDVFNSFDYTGWAFCETESDNSNKEISIILSNGKRTYINNVVEIKKRTDVVQAYQKKRKIKGIYHGISGTVSTVGVKNGIYRIYLYCKESEENYGLVYTGRMVKIDSRGVSPFAWVSSRCNIAQVHVEENIKYTIDSSTKDGNLQIKGWSFIEGTDTNNQLVYVRLTYENGETAIYNTEGYLREDVGKAYKSNLYNNSGFRAIIPVNELGEGSIKEINVLIEKDGIVYLSPKPYSYTSESETKSKNEDENVAKEYSDIITDINTEKIEESSDIRYNVDSCTVDKDIFINAWSFITDTESSQTKTYLAITTADGLTRVYTTSKRSRPDVAKAYMDELYTESGFTALIPLDAFSEGENTITVIADNGQMLKATKPYTFIYEAEGN